MNRYQIALKKSPAAKAEPSIYELLADLKWTNGSSIISKEEYEQAAREINEEMEKFDINHRAYMAYSREMASKAYLNF